jgi:sigma-B regulation protein RsbU (phosphoserine phosphatase)
MKILIAEDDPVSRRLLQSFLEKWGYQVAVAANGADAWRLFQEAYFPLVVSDWMMPEMDGLELIRHIRSSPRPGYVFTILLTARSHKEDVIEGMAAGADDFLTKPFDQGELRVRLRAGERIIRLEETLLEQNRALSEQNARMKADLQLACEIQQALLPRDYPSFPQGRPADQSVLRFCHRYQPTGTVGGDFFNVVPVSDTEAGVFLCDVMGHGVRSALVTAMVRALVEEHKAVGADPGRFLTELNRKVLAILGPTDLMIFLSAFYLIADAATGRIRYADAGHPTPFHVRRDLEVVGPLAMAAHMPGPPLGVRDNALYTVGQGSLAPGDLVLLFTDGVYEVNAPDQTEYGEARLLEAVRGRVGLPTGQLLDDLLADVQRFSGGTGFHDDVCLLSVEVAPPGPPSTGVSPPEGKGD